MAIPVIDIFAGPGGLGEGFCSLLNKEKKRVFKIALSIEKDEFAHKTLTLRSFFRQFEPGQVPNEYYEFIRGNITLDDLYKKHPIEAKEAAKESWRVTLGDSKGAVSNKDVDKRIQEALNGASDWLLIGGPPCQAYSIVGRSRRQEKILDEKKDERVGLYKQYLRILAKHNPAVFVMENVKGILSAETELSHVFTKILRDLAEPAKTYYEDFGQNGIQIKCPGYKIYSLALKPKSNNIAGEEVYDHSDFIIHSEKYGIPQTRHRVILLGVRNGINFTPDILIKSIEVGINKVLDGLPRLRSGLSKQNDNDANWKNAVISVTKQSFLKNLDQDVLDKIHEKSTQIKIPRKGRGAQFIPTKRTNIEYRADWFLDNKIGGVCNHEARGHMESDLRRYFFVACYANVKQKSPILEDFPLALLPNHENIDEGVQNNKFADRFRVQLADKPSKTITSHISKDGHYYIHYDATQCRSMTVREAARIQTFPDNYFFCGPRTAQFIQVGNAVPPLLANKIASIVLQIFRNINIINKHISKV